MTDLQAKYQKLATEYSKVRCRWCHLRSTFVADASCIRCCTL